MEEIIEVTTETKISIQEFIKQVFVDQDRTSIIREYIPISEKIAIIESLIDVFTHKYVNGEMTDELDLEPNYITEEIYTKTAILEFYTNLKIDDREVIYDLLDKNNLLDDIVKTISEDAVNFEGFIRIRTEEKREYLKSQIKSPMDNMFLSATNLIENINTTLESMDFESIIKMLPQIAKLGENFNQSDLVSQVLESFPKQVKVPEDHKAKTVKPKKAKVEKIVDISPTPTEV